MQQVGLGDVAAHAVPEQHNRRSGMLLANVLVKAGQVADHFAPAVLVCVMPRHAVLGGFAVTALIQGVQPITLFAQRFGQAGIAAAMFGHSMG